MIVGVGVQSLLQPRPIEPKRMAPEKELSCRRSPPVFSGLLHARRERDTMIAFAAAIDSLRRVAPTNRGRIRRLSRGLNRLIDRDLRRMGPPRVTIIDLNTIDYRLANYYFGRIMATNYACFTVKPNRMAGAFSLN
jgi:hypothetical protein